MTSRGKLRLDQLLVDRGLAGSREKARALVLAGAVLVDGKPAGKAGHAVPLNCLIEVQFPPAFVSRGGVKLAGALDHFNIDLRDRVCLDIGASTGGFTDCMLQRGAARVHAVDVGAGQIDWKLRNDPRVVLHENCNARFLRPDDIGEPAQVAAVDVSFISATLIIPVIVPILTAGASLLVLVKPQFEAGREAVGKGGIVRDPSVQAAACRRVQECMEGLGFQTAIVESLILGREGNREFFLHGWR